MNKKNLLLILVFTLLLIITSCTTPSPLIGSWADNAGNTIKFAEESQFTASILDSTDTVVAYSGTYTVNLNALIFEIEDTSAIILTEWDIRGNIMYLTWTDSDGVNKALSMYKID